MAELGRTAFRFVADAQGVAGRVRNRRTARGRWEGRARGGGLLGSERLGVRHGRPLAAEAWMRQSALSYFGRGVEQRSPWRAGDGVRRPGCRRGARRRAPSPRAPARCWPTPSRRSVRWATDADWPWPEPRLSYANAVLPEALLAAGRSARRDPRSSRTVSRLLRWLLDRETVDGHLSPTPVGGAGPGDRPPGFDQQPIEVAAMADACARAAAVTGDADWRRGIELGRRLVRG